MLSWLLTRLRTLILVSVTLMGVCAVVWLRLATTQPINLAVNPGFESGSPEPWRTVLNVAIVAEQAYAGQYAAQISGEGGLEQQMVDLQPNTAYYVRAFLKPGADEPLFLGVRQHGAPPQWVEVRGSEYQEAQLTFMTGANARSALLFIAKPLGSATAYADEVQFGPADASLPIEPTTPPTETALPTELPTEVPTELPTQSPTALPTETPTQLPTALPTETPTQLPTALPTETPTTIPTEVPTATMVPTEIPSPTAVPTQVPTEVPTATLTSLPATATASSAPTIVPPQVQPTATPTALATITLTSLPSATATARPSATATALPSATATARPSATATALPSATATARPSATATARPSTTATALPSVTATARPSATATALPSVTATALPSVTATATVPAGTARQWAVYEISLTAKNSYSDTDAYTRVEVSATFSGPGVQQTVRGYWDGGKTWRVRFTPMVAGTWTYSISSNQNDSGLSSTGTLQVSADNSARGFVRRDSNFPQAFRYDNGERMFMLGQTYYEIVRTAYANGGTNDTWKSGIDNSRSYGINKVRMLVHPWGGSDGNPNYYPDAFPFISNNHDRLDLAYWRELDQIVQYMQSRGMIADLVLFTDMHLAFGTQAQDERYTRYILARYAAYTNVIWCLSNEWEYTGKSKGYWDNIGGIVRNEDPWMRNNGALRPLSVHNRTNGSEGGKFSFFGSSWPTYAIIQWGIRNGRFEYADQWGNYSILQNTGNGMPVANDEFGYLGDVTQTTHRNGLWGIALGGGYASTGDKRIFSDGPGGAQSNPLRTGHWHDAPEYQDLRRFVDFWTTRNIPYWEMSSQNQLVTSGERVYVLGKPNSVYVVYAANGGDFGVAIPAGRSYSVTLYNPRDGSTTAMRDISGPMNWSLSSGQDWVLLIR